MNVKTHHYMRHGNFVGHQQVVYILVTSHEILAKKILVILSQVLQFVNGVFKNKMLSRATCEVH